MSKAGPLVTFALLAYNQEKYIRDAVEAALSQTYSPLEIIFSDDHSSDGTFQIMRKIALDYRGPHRIVLNRNGLTLGLGAHVNLVNRLATGELVVAAAGDDISFAKRVERLVQIWIETDKPSALSSQASVIDAAGMTVYPRFRGYEGFQPMPSDDRQNCLRRLIKDDHCILLGCTEAWQRSLFETFGDLAAGVVHEDNAMAFRAWLVDGVGYLDDVLVAYRVHDRNLALQKPKVYRSIEDFKLREVDNSRRSKRRGFHLAQHREDLIVARAKNLIGESEFREISKLLSLRIQENDAISCWWDASISGRLKTFAIAIGHLNSRLILWCAVRLGGLATYSFIRAHLGGLSRKLRGLSGKG